MAPADLDERTIEGFGIQWTEFTAATGWWGSVEGQFRDQIEPLVRLEDIAGKHCCDIGSGMGRIVRNLVAAGARHVTALEPSVQAFTTLKANTVDIADRVTLIQERGEAVPQDDFDLITCLGVLHHVSDPAPVVRAAHRGLREGGIFLAWLYGREGNLLYLWCVEPFRYVTRAMPLCALKSLCGILMLITDVYASMCRVLRLPMASYFTGVYQQFDRNKRFLAIFDQLHTTYAKYYRGAEARALLEDNGFQDVKLHHRKGYSWSVSGIKRPIKPTM